jgi:hypothetical protein
MDLKSTEEYKTQHCKIMCSKYVETNEYKFIYFLMKDNINKSMEIYNDSINTDDNIDLKKIFVDSCKSGLVNKTKKIYNFSKSVNIDVDVDVNIFSNNYELFIYCHEKNYLGIINYFFLLCDNNNELQLQLQLLLSCLNRNLENIKKYWDEIQKNNGLTLDFIKILLTNSYTQCYFEIVSWILEECERKNLLIPFSFINNLSSKHELWYYSRFDLCIRYQYKFCEIFASLCAIYNKKIFVMKHKILFLSPDDCFIYEAKRGILNINNFENLYISENYENMDDINIHYKDEMAFRIICNRRDLKMAKWLWNYSQIINSPINVRANNDEIFLNSIKPSYHVSGEIIWEDILGVDDDDKDVNYNNNLKKINKMTEWLCSICCDYDVFHDANGNICHNLNSSHKQKVNIVDENEDIII